MEKSFSDYRDNTMEDSDSDSAVIDNSLVYENSISLKTPTVKNRTCYVAESEDSLSDVIEDNELIKQSSKSVVGRCSASAQHVILSGDDDSIKESSRSNYHSTVISSSSEEEVSPEQVPKRRPVPKPKLNKSYTHESPVIGRKVRKRIMLLDSDTENSIVIEHDRNKKMTCLKDTPLKIYNKKIKDNERGDFSGSDFSVNGDIEESIDDNEESSDDDRKSDNGYEKSGDDDRKSNNGYEKSRDDDGKSDGDDEECDNGDESDDGPDEDQMAMSRATRMSIMGVIPKDNENDSDDSDFIVSDESNLRSRSSHGSVDSIHETNDTVNLKSEIENNVKDIEVIKTPEKNVDDNDTSKLICSPFSSPVDLDKTKTNYPILKEKSFNVVDSPHDEAKNLKSKVLNKLTEDDKLRKDLMEDDDDVRIIDSKEPEIIALSSDDEIEPKEVMPSKPKKSVSKVLKEGNMNQYLTSSYPNQVVYVKKQVRDSEMAKLKGLQQDLQAVKKLLEHLDMSTLPDGGEKVLERMTKLETAVRSQGEKVASMVVEPEKPTAADIARDGFDKENKGLTWDDIQKASNAVQPRMFGKQAMSTHVAERNEILERLRDLHAALGSRPAGDARAPPPRALSATLLPHQLHALAWLQWRDTQRPVGGILADDMGLGKTITVLSLVLSDKERNIDADDDDDDDDDRGPKKTNLVRGGTLVVCPASLVTQWADEATRHCAAGALSLLQHHGPARPAAPARLAQYDLVVTTYNILQRDAEKNGVLVRVRWRRVVLDEAHVVRNHKAATSRAVCSLRARSRLALTGTPLHNRDLDLFALLKFLRCSPFDELPMWKKWIDNKSVGGQERLNTIMQCIMLRRTKTQLQQRGQLQCLPKRTAHEILVTLTKDEMNVYQKVLVFSKTLFAQFLHQRAEKNEAMGFMGKNPEYDRMHKKMIALQGVKPVKSHEILVLLLRLRQVCGHCGLIAAMLGDDDANVEEDQGSKDLLDELNKLSLEDSKKKTNNQEHDDENEEESPQEGTSVAEAIRSVLSINNPVFHLDRPSSKIEAVMKCLQDNVFVNKGEKAVVVSQWTSVLRLVEARLSARGVRSTTLSGAVPVRARASLVQSLNDVNSDVKVMLLSLCAGGVGLNLCGANHLLLLDPHWNPQLEEQAQDRIYRVGQTKPVHIYRFMCVGTVEHTIRKLQQDKLELAENVLTGAKNTNASKLTIEDLKMLFNMAQ